MWKLVLVHYAYASTYVNAEGKRYKYFGNLKVIGCMNVPWDATEGLRVVQIMASHFVYHNQACIDDCILNQC